MYKYLIVGVTFLVIGGAGYYFNATGGGDLVIQAVAQTNGNEGGVKGVDVFSGVYECDVSTGCKKLTRFLLNDDTTFEIKEIYEDGDVESSVRTGSWGVAHGGVLVFIIDPVTTGTTSPSFSFVAKKVNGIKISGFSSKVKLLGNIENPTLTRISN